MRELRRRVAGVRQVTGGDRLREPHRQVDVGRAMMLGCVGTIIGLFAGGMGGHILLRLLIASGSTGLSDAGPGVAILLEVGGAMVGAVAGAILGAVLGGSGRV